jgi:hypothetical protein
VRQFCWHKIQKRKRKGSKTRPHSSPDPSCGREISRGRANPKPQKNCLPCLVRIVCISFVGIFCKMGSDFFKQTPPNLICRRSCLGASRGRPPSFFDFALKGNSAINIEKRCYNSFMAEDTRESVEKRLWRRTFGFYARGGELKCQCFNF